MGKKVKKKRLPDTDTPVYDRLVADTGFAPHEPPPPGGWRNHLSLAGLLEDNFS